MGARGPLEDQNTSMEASLDFSGPEDIQGL